MVCVCECVFVIRNESATVRKQAVKKQEVEGEGGGRTERKSDSGGRK